MSDDSHRDEPFQVELTDTFDLHSFAPKDMRSAVEEYLHEAHQRGWPAIRIIHGRGIGRQREMVRKILAESAFVITFGDAPLEAGGWGATIATMGAKAT